MLRLTALRSWLMRSLICMFAIGPASAVASAPSSPDSRLILRLDNDVQVVNGSHVHHSSSHAQDVETRLNGILHALHIQDVTFERSVDDSVVVLRFSTALSEEQVAEITDRLSHYPGVLYAEPDGRVQAAALVPNDPFRANQWYQYETYGINAYNAWDLERGASGVVMALVDTGIRTHADIDPARVLSGYDFISDPATSNDGDGWDADPTDPGDAVAADECSAGSPAEDSSWHGLHLAGIMAASTDNGVGVAGINHFSQLLPVRVLGKCGGSFSDIIAGILWSAGLPVSGVATNPTPAKVINLSFAGLGLCTPAVQDAIDRAVAAGSIVIAAAGNENGTDVASVLPAGCNNVIAVAATDRSGSVASYSNVGSRVLLSAPGGGGSFANGIYSTYNSGTSAPGADSYTYFVGTSVAAAEVSAAVSLLVSTQPLLTVSNVRQILSQTAQPYASTCPTSLACGAGILDLYAAVQLARTITPGDPAVPANSGGGGGGGGGGCVLSPRTERTPDVAWLMLLLFLGGSRLRRQSTRF